MTRQRQWKIDTLIADYGIEPKTAVELVDEEEKLDKEFKRRFEEVRDKLEREIADRKRLLLAETIGKQK